MTLIRVMLCGAVATRRGGREPDSTDRDVAASPFPVSAHQPDAKVPERRLSNLLWVLATGAPASIVYADETVVGLPGNRTVTIAMPVWRWTIRRTCPSSEIAKSVLG
jgi:hypothetical protein